MKAPWPYKLYVFGLLALAYAFFYVVPNTFPVFPPVPMPTFAFERELPFMPWTVLVYMSDYLMVALVIALLPDAASFNQLARRAFIALVISSLFFWFLPTLAPRPLDFQETGWMADLNRCLWVIDGQGNCFPSLHVGFTGLGAISLFVRSRTLGWIFVLWTVAISVSVLTVKQHYFWDILGGIAMILLASSLDRYFANWPAYKRWVSRMDRTPWWSYSIPNR